MTADVVFEQMLHLQRLSPSVPVGNCRELTLFAWRRALAAVVAIGTVWDSRELQTMLPV